MQQWYRHWLKRKYFLPLFYSSFAIILLFLFCCFLPFRAMWRREVNFVNWWVRKIFLCYLLQSDFLMCKFPNQHRNDDCYPCLKWICWQNNKLVTKIYWLMLKMEFTISLNLFSYFPKWFNIHIYWIGVRCWNFGSWVPIHGNAVWIRTDLMATTVKNVGNFEIRRTKKPFTEL